MYLKIICKHRQNRFNSLNVSKKKTYSQLSILVYKRPSRHLMSIFFLFKMVLKGQFRTIRLIDICPMKSTKEISTKVDFTNTSSVCHLIDGALQLTIFFHLICDIVVK